MSTPRRSPVVYDREADVLYLRLSDLNVAYTRELDDLRLVDYATDGSVVGIEFVNASLGLDLTGVPLRDEVEQLIHAGGDRFPVFA